MKRYYVKACHEIKVLVFTYVSLEISNIKRNPVHFTGKSSDKLLYTGTVNGMIKLYRFFFV